MSLFGFNRDDAHDQQYDGASTYYKSWLNLCRNVTNVTATDTCGSHAPLQVAETTKWKANVCWNIGSVWDNATAIRPVVENEGIQVELQIGVTRCCPHGNLPGNSLLIPVRVSVRPGGCRTERPWTIEANYNILTDCRPTGSLVVNVTTPQLCNDAILWRLLPGNVSFSCRHRSNEATNCTVIAVTAQQGKQVTSYVCSRSFHVQVTFFGQDRVRGLNWTLPQLLGMNVTADGSGCLFTLPDINRSLCHIQLFYTFPKQVSVEVGQFKFDCKTSSNTSTVVRIGVGIGVGIAAFVVCLVLYLVWRRKWRTRRKSEAETKQLLGKEKTGAGEPIAGTRQGESEGRRERESSDSTHVESNSDTHESEDPWRDFGNEINSRCYDSTVVAGERVLKYPSRLVSENPIDKNPP